LFEKASALPEPFDFGLRERGKSLRQVRHMLVIHPLLNPEWTRGSPSFTMRAYRTERKPAINYGNGALRRQ
jgi:hypothetical protein